LLNLIGFPLNSNWTRCLQASQDGFSNFHNKCDGILGTLVVLKTGTNSSNQFIFGGYTQVGWSDSVCYPCWGYFDKNAFLFSLVNLYSSPVKMNVIKPEKAILVAPYYGPSFGFDVSISLDGSYGYAGLGQSYSLPSFINDTQTDYTFLAGSLRFIPIEMEVYHIN
jgi:hypothetical protein